MTAAMDAQDPIEIEETSKRAKEDAGVKGREEVRVHATWHVLRRPRLCEPHMAHGMLVPYRQCAAYDCHHECAGSDRDRERASSEACGGQGALWGRR